MTTGWSEEVAWAGVNVKANRIMRMSGVTPTCFNLRVTIEIVCGGI
jgi:hypothetical protein